MAVYAAINQRHANTGSGELRLPGDLRVYCRRRIAQRRAERAVLTDVSDAWVVRQVHETGAVKYGNNPVDYRYLAQDGPTKLGDVVEQAADEAQQAAAGHLRARRVLHDDLHLRTCVEVGQQVRRNFRRVRQQWRRRKHQYENQYENLFHSPSEWLLGEGLSRGYLP